MSLGALEYQAFDEDQAQVAKAAFNVFSADPFATDAGRSAGWFAVGIPEELGGAGGSPVDLAAVLESCGAAMAASALPVSAGVIGRLLCRLPDVSKPARELIGAIADGAVLSIPAGTNPAKAPDISSPVSMSVMTLGPVNAPLVMPVRRDGEPCLVHLPIAGAGADPARISAAAVDALDPSRRWSRVSLVEADLREHVIATGPDLLDQWQRLLGVACALDSAGAARTALARTVAYASVRHQFGRPLGSFQAYKHRCAEAFVDLKLAQSVAFRAMTADAQEHDVPHEWAAALEATRAATAVCRAAVQLHGGIGFSWEGEVHTFLRRTRANEILAGPVHAVAAVLEPAERR